MLDTGLTAFSVAAFCGLLALFVVPGVLIVRWWDRRAELDRAGQLALGAVASFGLFSLTTGPLLVAHASTDTALAVVAGVWFVVSLGLLRVGRRPVGVATTAPHEAAEFQPWPVGQGRLVAVAAGLSLLVVWLFAARIGPRAVTLPAMVLAFVANLWVWRRLARCRAPASGPTFTPTWSRGVRVPLALLLGFALVTTTVMVREDMDDTLYLAEALLLRDSPAMAEFSPAHRGEDLPPTTIYAWQTYELFAALLGRLSGIHPLAVTRTLFAPLLLLLAVGLYRELLRRLLPPAAVSTALLILVAYFVFGMSSHWTAANFLLPRPAQGKSWLVHVGLTALAVLALELVRRPGLRVQVLLMLASFAALGFAPTAVFVAPAVVGLVVLAALALREPGVGVNALLAAAAVAVPHAAFALYVLMDPSSALRDVTIDRDGTMSWRDVFFMRHLGVRHADAPCSAAGAIELLALVALPLTAVFHVRRRDWSYPVVFTVLAFVTLLDPLFFGLVAGRLTGQEGDYARLFWILPFAVIVALLGTGCVAGALRTGRPVAVAALVAVLAALPLLGGRFVWSPTNVQSAETPIPYRTTNAFKMPQGLLEVASDLAGRELGPDRRILCSERSASHLAPLVPAFDFVYTRVYQTTAPLLMLGRVDEEERRRRLAREFLAGTMETAEARELLELERATYVVVDPSRAAVVEQLRAIGYRLLAESDGYSCWVRG